MDTELVPTVGALYLLMFVLYSFILSAAGFFLTVARCGADELRKE